MGFVQGFYKDRGQSFGPEALPVVVGDQIVSEFDQHVWAVRASSVTVDGVAGMVVALHPTSVELLADDGSSVHLANTRLTRGELRVGQPDPNPGGNPSV